MSNTAKVSGNPFDIFVIGARKGFNIAINNLMPNVLMAYVIAEMLNLLGVMQIIGHICAPVMGLFGLPGEAITVLLTAWLSSSAGTGVAVSLLSKGQLDVGQITILAPAIFLMGSQLQYMGRLLGVADVPKKYWPLLMAVSILNAVISMLIMRVIA
ncbi:Spore maturation protein SpmB [Kosakonia oryzendophytica]|jgi:spore maturation protein SpmB|uniref:Spore maturation protein SpmB n=1 Tax=Kosakonia oryzendophytica TaxID=1005665 RepID=A0A1C4A2K5_9ENTR|nr:MULTISPECIES: YjiG family protein [Kosakonia]AMO50697.1 Transporter gate domain protein [Enterobacter sp. FY-07]TDT52328.1 spore maturation protein SpmB [Enterobacter sp. AG5470]UXY10363.1 YjiG family protein [Kosakonia sp. ML.JS2a]WBT57640.1 YjiG family protein [Kosakonia oryzendophytica]SCB88775.1 Spore maturation protein SpmB [Kosakonia oryzendophytica]